MSEEGIEGYDTISMYVNEIQGSLLSAEEASRLGILASAGDKEAQDTLVQGNLRLVIWIAKRCRNRGVDLADLIQEGNLGLMRATKTFDPEKGMFSTYATWWIRQAMDRAIMNQARTIRVPVNLAKLFRKKIPRGCSLSEDDKKNMSLFLATETESLDTTPRAFEGTKKVGDILFDHSPGPAELAEMSIDLSPYLEVLKPKQREVIARIYGLDGHHGDSFRQVGLKMKLSCERIRQIHSMAIKKIRKRMRIKGCVAEDFFSA